jgi:hypothetical protein
MEGQVKLMTKADKLFREHVRKIPSIVKTRSDTKIKERHRYWAHNRVHSGRIVDRCDDLETTYDQMLTRCYNRKKNGSLGYWSLADKIRDQQTAIEAKLGEQKSIIDHLQLVYRGAFTAVIYAVIIGFLAFAYHLSLSLAT